LQLEPNTSAFRVFHTSTFSEAFEVQCSAFC
jgi:hypothetical protein